MSLVPLSRDEGSNRATLETPRPKTSPCAPAPPPTDPPATGAPPPEAAPTSRLDQPCPSPKSPPASSAPIAAARSSSPKAASPAAPAATPAAAKQMQEEERWTIYRWATERGITPQVAYSWRKQGLPVDPENRIKPTEADRWLEERLSSKRRRRTVLGQDSDRDAWFRKLKDDEAESKANAFASLTFLRSQGRTLSKGSQIEFIDFDLATGCA